MSSSTKIDLSSVELDKPFLEWVQNNPENVTSGNEKRNALELLMKRYKKTNDLYDKRFTSGESLINQLTDLLLEVEENEGAESNNSTNKESEVKITDNDTISKAKKIVIANILLRRGQVKANEFIEPSNDFQAACAILEYTLQKKDLQGNCPLDFLDYLAWLNLGKYYRNMGMCYGRSDFFWRAHDEFSGILRALMHQKSTASDKEPAYEPWKLYILLETVMNLSRTKLYLYKTKEAKVYLWSVYVTINSSSSKKSLLFEDERSKEDSKRRSQLDKSLTPYNNELTWMQQLIKSFTKSPCSDGNQGSEKTNEYKDVFKAYLTQVLVQLGICYRKTRDYEFSREIFLDILNNVDYENVDAKNNYAVCLRKVGFKISFIDEKKEKELLQISTDCDPSIKDFQEGYLSLVYSLRKGKNRVNNVNCENNEQVSCNRFATIEYIRSLLQEGNNNKEKIDEAGKLIDELLDKNPADRNIALQKALLLQKQGNTQESQKILEKLYLEAPQISAGTIGLKAYYNMGCNLLQEKKYYEAKKYFSKIKGNISRDMNSSNGTGQNDLMLEDLPPIDLLSSVDYAWCLMNIGDFEGARKEYEYILECYKNWQDRMGFYNRIKIENNLTECLLQKLSREIQAKQGKLECGEIKEDLQKLGESINNKLADLEKEEPDNPVVARNRGYYYLLKARMESNVELYNKAIEQFSKAMVPRYNDAYICSGWVCAAYEPLVRRLKRSDTDEIEIDENDKKMIESVFHRIKSGVGVYSMKSCAKLSELVSIIDGKASNEEISKMLYRSIARINISENEDGYSIFRDLRENDAFSGLEAEQRGKIMALFFQLYVIILKIKDDCRFYPKSDDDLPVHYRSMARLRSYLLNDSKNKGRLSLWNIAYMNDYQEGQSFIAMLKSESKKLDVDLPSVIDQCFFRQLSEKTLMPAGNENVYITSLSLKKDFIPMWIAYAENGTGCALTYAEDFLNLRKGPDDLTDVSEYSDRDFPLYKVVYVNTKKYDEIKAEDSDITVKGENQERETRVIKLVGEASRIIKQLMEHLEKQFEGTEKRELKVFMEQAIGTCLNQVRFLLKDIEYESEDEIRIVHYSKEYLIDAPENKMPRLYIELNRDVQIEQVTLGPKVNSYDESELITWLSQTERVKYIQRSERHYR